MQDATGVHMLMNPPWRNATDKESAEIVAMLRLICINMESVSVSTLHTSLPPPPSPTHRWNFWVKDAWHFLCSEPEWEFMKKLEDVEAVEREKAIFECDVSDPEADVTWWRGEKVHNSVYCCLAIHFHGWRRFLFLFSSCGNLELFQLRCPG